MLKSMLIMSLVLCTLGCASTSHLSEGDTEAPDLADGCRTPLGFVPEGRSATGYLRPLEQAQNCQQGTITCEDGVWFGAYIFPSCIKQ